MPVISIVEAINSAIMEEMTADPAVVVLGEDIGLRGGVFLATQGLLDTFGEERVIDTPLGEASIAGIALGLAFKGLRPIAEIQFADFWWLTANQIIGEASRVFYGSNGNLKAPMLVRIPYGGGVRGGLFHSQSIESYLYNTPGLKVVAPSTPFDAKGLLKSSIRDDNPVIFLEHKKSYRSIKGDVPDGEYTIPIGQADIKRHGDDVSVFTYGMILHNVMESADILENEDISVEVVDLRTLRPLDEDTILGSVKKTSKSLIVHEANITGGVGAEVSAIISSKGFQYLDAPVSRLCGPDIPAMPFAKNLEEEYMLNTDKITDAILNLTSY